MRIALDEIDPHIAKMVVATAPAHPIRQPVQRIPRPRLSRRRRLALAASVVLPPMIGFQLATLAATMFHSTVGWLPWVVWFGTWAAGTGMGLRVALKERLASRRAAVVLTATALVAPIVSFAAAVATFDFGNGVSLAFWMAWLTLSMVIAIKGSQLALNIAPQSAAVTELQPENMKTIFAALSLTRAERVYCDVLLFLSRTQTSAETEQTMRETLCQLNDLMQAADNWKSSA